VRRIEADDRIDPEPEEFRTMFTFADLLKQAQGGQALDNIAAAYGLKRGDVEAMSGALLPMFQIGFQRSFADRGATSTVADLVDPDKFGAAFEDVHAALSPGVTEAGRMALANLFGSPDAARVLADQTAAITGIGSDVVSKVMPTLAATLLGGVGKAIADTPMRAILEAWSGGVDPATDPLTAVTAPYRDAMAAFLKGYARGKPGSASPDPAWTNGMEAVGRMFQAGVELSEQNRRAFEQVLDGFRKS
jgi:hypothetical protein